MTTSLALSPRQSRIVEALHPIFGTEAASVYEAHERSLLKLAGFARDSSLPSCHRFVTALALARELLDEELRAATILDAPQAVTEYLKLHFAGQPHESFAVLFLDARHAMLAFEDVFRGTLTQTSVYPREVVKRALHHNAAAVVLAHNHPSGACDPSAADLRLTQVLAKALALVDVRVLDHLVVAGARSVSMAQRGLL